MKESGKNNGVWHGRVVSDLVFDHELREEKFYTFQIETETLYSKKMQLKDVSVLPVKVSEKQLTDETKNLKVGDIVFLKGQWRAYDRMDEQSQNTKVQTIYAKLLKKTDGYIANTRNKFEFEGVLVKKLHKILRDENGNVQIDPTTNKPFPKRDENGEIEYGTRKNREGATVNDFMVAINRVKKVEQGSAKKEFVPLKTDYIPCIAYGKIARYIAKNVNISDKLSGSGYTRARHYKDSHGRDRVAYEAVITVINGMDLEMDFEGNKAED